MKKALVVLSGGQDSATCLLWAKQEFEYIEAISFDYGQRHRVELDCAKVQTERLGVRWRLVDFTFLNSLGRNALTDIDIPVDISGGFQESLPSTFVPGRNLLFMTAAAAYAANEGIDTLVTGVCQTDYSGYPDCRRNTMDALEQALELGINTKINIVTPLMYLTKAETWEMAEELGGLDLIIHDTHTCYNGNHETLHPWGYGCDDCPACELRKKGFMEGTSIAPID